MEAKENQHWAKCIPNAADLAGRRIEDIEREFLKCEQVACPVVHSFAPGIYMREVALPAGSFVIGHHQNFEHMNIFLKGKVTMLNDDGTAVTLTAPMRFIGKPGRKIGYIHEDVVWMNVYATDERDVEKLEKIFLTKSDSWHESVEAKESLKLIKTEVDSSDFILAIQELGVSEEQVKLESENQDDMTELPSGSYKIKTAKSTIDGTGLFATGNFEIGEVIAPARIGGKRTIAGRFTNHSLSPNSKMVGDKLGDIYLVATAAISGCHGGLDGDEITINYREAFALNLKLRNGGKI